MKANTQKHPLEAKALAIVEGFRSIPQPHLPFSFEKENLDPGQVVARFTKSLAHFEEVRRTRAEYEAAVEKCDRSLPELRSLCEEAVVVAKRHFGSDPKRMETFGVRAAQRPRTKRDRRACRVEGATEVVTTVIEEVITTCSAPGCGGEEARCGCSKAKPPERVATPPCRAPGAPPAAAEVLSRGV